MDNEEKIEGFTIVPNSLINNENISTGAKGMFLFLNSKPPNWSFSENKIKKQIKENETFIKRTLKELESFGYLVRKRIMVKGQNKGMEYILNPSPNKIKTSVGKSNVGKSNVGKPISFSNKDFSNKEINKEIERELSPFDFLKINFSNEVIEIETEYKSKFLTNDWEFTIEKFNAFYLKKNVSVTKLKKWIVDEINFNENKIKTSVYQTKNKNSYEERPPYMDNIIR